MLITPPPASQNFGFYDAYVNNARHTDLFTALDIAHKSSLAVLTPLTDEQCNYRYAEGKWSIKEIIQHLMDAERNFCLRAMRFSREDKELLPSYKDITALVLASVANRRTKEDLMEEWDLLRKATLIQFKTFAPEMLDRSGPMRDTEVSVRALGFLIAGHEMHHAAVLKERYTAQATL